METVLAGLAGNMVSNATSEWHAGKQMQRETRLMGIQNDMNKANALSAYQNQVQGARMAGLSPALLNGQTPQVAAPVSKGSVSQAENVEIDPATLLLQAQKENIEADTAKKQAEVPNVQADTGKKIAERLYTNAGTDKVQAETQNINNINDTYAAQNRSLAEMGKGMAEKWQSEPWYNKLSPQTKDTIDSIAVGTTPLSVGGMAALQDVIKAQKDLSDADRALVKNAFDNAIMDAQFSDEAIMKAIADSPKNEQERLKAQIDNIKAATNKLKAELPKIAAEIKNLKSDTALKYAEKKIKDVMFKQLNLDPNVRRYDGDVLGYLGSMGQKLLEGAINMLPALAGGYMTGKMAGSGIKSATDNAGKQGYGQGRAAGAGDSWEANRRRDSYFYWNRDAGQQDLFGVQQMRK